MHTVVGRIVLIQKLKSKSARNPKKFGWRKEKSPFREENEAGVGAKKNTYHDDCEVCFTLSDWVHTWIIVVIKYTNRISVFNM